jgi:hypothetical protein
VRNELERLLTQRQIEGRLPTPRYVLFVDMLGFSDLTERHPDPVVWDFEAEEFAASTTDSALQLGKFQHVLNSIAEWSPDSARPSHLMQFSDCAFLVYENLVQAIESSTDLMRRFLKAPVPVRMGLAQGSWHPRRFSFDSEALIITRAVFYGTGVVRATLAEKHGGKGCRIFVHASIDRTAFSDQKIDILDVQSGHASVPYELNYLHPEELDEMAIDNDGKLHIGLTMLYNSLDRPRKPEVERQYLQTVEALASMRAQLRRPPLCARPSAPHSFNE